MTGNDIIALVDLKEPNSYTTDEKIRWLSNLDGKIFEEVIKQYEEYDPEEDTFTPYEDGSEELLVGAPYGEDMYVNVEDSDISDAVFQEFLRMVEEEGEDE